MTTTTVAVALAACAPTVSRTAVPTDGSTEAADAAAAEVAAPPKDPTAPLPDGVTCAPTTDGLAMPLAPPAADDRDFPWDDRDAAVVDGFDPGEVLRGGPPPDGIAPIDSPCVVPVAGGDVWLDDDEGVLVVEVGGEARAYPLAIMTQHEIVNDLLGGEPLVVTYCPLCNSGLAFSRVLDGEVWDFGTSGRLLRSNLVMYDRQTRTLWSQFTGGALWGDPAVVGRELERLPTQVLGWATFREAFPDGTVLGRDSFPGRIYGRNPYVGYEDAPSTFLFRGDTDDRLDPDERVVGVGDEDDAVAVPLARLQQEQVVTVEVDGGTVSIVWAAGQASALDDERISEGRHVGQTGAFLVDVLEPDGANRFRDPATGAVHDVTGRTIEGDAAALTPVPLDDTFWFVWFAFRPGTAIAAG